MMNLTVLTLLVVTTGTAVFVQGETIMANLDAVLQLLQDPEKRSDFLLSSEEERVMMERAKELQRMLPKIREMVREMIQRVGEASDFLAFLPRRLKVALARQRAAAFSEELDAFLSLPVHVQERMLGQILARNENAREAFEENVDILKEVGLVLNFKRVLDIADRTRAKITFTINRRDEI